MVSRQCILLAKELEDIEREKFDGSPAKCQIRQYFSLSINCAIRYTHFEEHLKIISNPFSCTLPSMHILCPDFKVLRPLDHLYVCIHSYKF